MINFIHPRQMLPAFLRAFGAFLHAYRFPGYGAGGRRVSGVALPRAGLGRGGGPGCDRRGLWAVVHAAALSAGRVEGVLNPPYSRSYASQWVLTGAVTAYRAWSARPGW